MKRTGISGLFFVLAGAGLLSCRRTEGPVAAQVGDQKITVEDFKSRLQETPANYQQYVSSEEGRRQFLNLLVREKVLLSEAQSLGIPRDPSYRAAIEKFKGDWKHRLKEYEETLQIESALRRLRTKDLAVTDTEVERYYDDHRAVYQRPVEILAAHILLNSQEDAAAALDHLKAGDSFEKVAREMSKDPTTQSRGGRLSPFRRGTFPLPEFDEAASRLKVGQTSGVVKSQFGFHIIRKLGERQLPAISLAEAKEEIRPMLERDKFNQWVAAKQAGLGVKINEQAVAQVSIEESPKP